MTLPRLLRIKDVAQIMGIAPWRLYDLVRQGELPHIRIGKTIRISEAAIQGWIEKHETSTTKGSSE